MIPEVEGTIPWGPSRKRVPKCLKGPQTTYATIVVAEKQSKRSKMGPFSLYNRSPGSHPGNGMNGTRRGRSLPVHPGFSSHVLGTRHGSMFGLAQLRHRTNSRLGSRLETRLSFVPRLRLTSRRGEGGPTEHQIFRFLSLNRVICIFCSICSKCFVMWKNRASLQHGSGLTLADISRFIGHCRYMKFLLRPSP